MLEPGTQIGGYRVDDFIAAGGMGAVYRATQLSLQRIVALKLISDPLGHDPAFRARFRREAVLQAALEHPHIVPVYEAGESEHGLFIAMRYLRGSSLEELIPRLAREHALQLLEGIASALDAAHATGLVHRDVKPHNILIADDLAYLADFGLTTATGLSSMTSAGQFMGTVDYVSPEQIRDAEPDARSDIYSFGAVVYRCLTGSVPFPRSTKVAVIYAQLEQQPDAASSVAPELPAALDPILARALAKDPDARYSSASELIRQARAALGRHPAGALAPSAPARGGAERRKSTTTAESEATEVITAVKAAAERAAVRRAAAERAALLRTGRPWAAAAGGCTVVLVAALAGLAAYLIRHNSGSARPLGPTAPLSATGVSIQVPVAWREIHLPLPELFGPKEIAATTAAQPPGIRHAAVVIGLSRGLGPSMLPLRLQGVPGALGATPARVRTRAGLGGLLYTFTGTGEHARGVSEPARRYAILFVPTGHLVATVACVAPTSAPSGPLFSDCRQIMSTLTDPAALPVDPRGFYATFLSDAFTSLSRSESSGLAAIAGASGRAAQAAAAASIANAYTAAHASFQRLIGNGLSAPEVGLHFALRNGLDALAADYRALVGAATTGNAPSYAADVAQLKRDRQSLSADIYELNREGYTLAK